MEVNSTISGEHSSVLSSHSIFAVKFIEKIDTLFNGKLNNPPLLLVPVQANKFDKIVILRSCQHFISQRLVIIGESNEINLSKIIWSHAHQCSQSECDEIDAFISNIIKRCFLNNTDEQNNNIRSHDLAILSIWSSCSPRKLESLVLMTLNCVDVIVDKLLFILGGKYGIPDMLPLAVVFLSFLVEFYKKKDNVLTETNVIQLARLCLSRAVYPSAISSARDNNNISQLSANYESTLCRIGLRRLLDIDIFKTAECSRVELSSFLKKWWARLKIATEGSDGGYEMPCQTSPDSVSILRLALEVVTDILDKIPSLSFALASTTTPGQSSIDINILTKYILSSDPKTSYTGIKLFLLLMKKPCYVSLSFDSFKLPLQEILSYSDKLMTMQNVTNNNKSNTVTSIVMASKCVLEPLSCALIHVIFLLTSESKEFWKSATEYSSSDSVLMKSLTSTLLASFEMLCSSLSSLSKIERQNKSSSVNATSIEIRNEVEDSLFSCSIMLVMLIANITSNITVEQISSSVRSSLAHLQEENIIMGEIFRSSSSRLKRGMLEGIKTERQCDTDLQIALSFAASEQATITITTTATTTIPPSTSAVYSVEKRSMGDDNDSDGDIDTGDEEMMLCENSGGDGESRRIFKATLKHKKQSFGVMNTSSAASSSTHVQQEGDIYMKMSESCCDDDDTTKLSICCDDADGSGTASTELKLKASSLESENIYLKEEISALKRNLTSVGSINNDLNSQVTDLKLSLAGDQAQLRDVRDELAGLREQSFASSEKWIRLESKLKEFEQLHVAQEKMLQETYAKLSLVSKSELKSQLEASTAIAKCEELHSEMEKIYKAHRVAKEESAKVTAICESQKIFLGEKDAKIQEYSGDILTLQQQVRLLQAEKSSLDGQMRILVEKTQSQNAAMKNAESIIRDKDSQLMESRSKISSLNSSVAELESSLEDSNGQIRRLKAVEAELQSTLSNANKSNDDLKTELEKQKEVITMIRNLTISKGNNQF